MRSLYEFCQIITEQRLPAYQTDLADLVDQLMRTGKIPLKSCRISESRLRERGEMAASPAIEITVRHHIIFQPGQFVCASETENGFAVVKNLEGQLAIIDLKMLG